MRPRRFVTVLTLVLIGLVFGLSASTLAQQDIIVTVDQDTALHAIPDLAAPVTELILIPAQLTVTGRDYTGHWLWLPERGWIATGYVTLTDDVNLHNDLPVVDAIPDTLATALRQDLEPPMETFTNDPAILSYIQRLRETPILYNMDSETVIDIFRVGQSRGMRPDVFSKIGDSNTASGDYMRPLGMADGEYCDLGPFNYLQTTIDHFSTSPRDGVPNSFDTVGFAARDALSMAGVLDPTWAVAAECAAGESPLLCEYRVNRPMVAIIMLGRGDVVYGDPDFYRASTVEVVQSSMAQGVIPVLTTFVLLPEDIYWARTLEYDAILIDIAEEYNIPLINLWRAVQTLPQYGIGPDLSHLAHAVGEFCNFTGAEMVYGGTLRTLLSLQALDEIRRTVLAGG